MSKKINLIFLILLTAAILFVLISCDNGSAKDKTDDPVSGINSEIPSDNPNDGDGSEFNPENENYGGYEFRMLNFISYGSDWAAFSYSEVEPESMNAEPINDAIFLRNTKVEELYNVKIKEVLHGDPNDDYTGTITKTIRLVMSGDADFDAALSVGNAMPRIFAQQNITYDLLAIPGLDLSKSWWDQNCVKDFSLGGKLNSVTGDITLWHSLASEVVYFNKKLVEECALANPYELVYSGEWTWDAMENMARSVIRDLDGDGKIDRSDQIGIASETGSEMCAIYGAGERLTYKDNDGLPVLNKNLYRISDVLDKAIPVLRSTEYAYSTSDLYGKYRNPYFDFTMPKFRDNQTLFYCQQLMVALNLREMEADFGILPFPKLDAQQDGYYSVATNHFLKFVWIPTTNGEQGRAAVILQAMAYYSQQLATPALYDVTITNKALRDEDSREMLEIIRKNRVYDIAQLYGWGDIFGIYNRIYEKRANNLASEFEKRVEAIEKAIQATIDEIFG